MDSTEVCDAFPKLNSLKLFDWKIGVAHDPSTITGIGKVKDVVKQNGFNAFIFGHTHSSSIKWEGKILFINPGSPITPETPFNKPTVALLKITKEAIAPEIIQL
jgi:predicted phosphodiesterase